jgi:hypothetical protein
MKEINMPAPLKRVKRLELQEDIDVPRGLYNKFVPQNFAMPLYQCDTDALPTTNARKRPPGRLPGDEKYF